MKFDEAIETAMELAESNFMKATETYTEFFEKATSDEEVAAMNAMLGQVLEKYQEMTDIIVSYGERFKTNNL